MLSENFLYIEPLNTNAGIAYTLNDFNVKSKTVSDLKQAMAGLIPEVADNYWNDQILATLGILSTILKTLHFTHMEGQPLSLSNVPINLTIGELKARLVSEKSISNDGVFYSWAKKNLEDNQRLMDYGIGEGSTIVIGHRKRGG
ncbi:hypothetical protein QBC38DRAFT_502568 [Podospora fimiseda]|uniref:Ubiquitin-like domain-containing protein n=1 Tax=Podospora fimiseda TaxID=252190 RepID=A0AAN7BIL6_9PEZI|nr:hypothetical protein QBC38DRAFT_502568 [Podospora fimiseda]